MAKCCSDSGLGENEKRSVLQLSPPPPQEDWPNNDDGDDDADDDDDDGDDVDDDDDDDGALFCESHQRLFQEVLDGLNK